MLPALSALSTETRKILTSKKGYRNDEFFGDRVLDLYDIIQYEIIELGNEDIPDTLLNTQPEFQNYIKDGSLEELAKSCCVFLKEKYPRYKTGLWLATKEAVQTLYRGTENISEYHIPAEYIVLSDLGFDGCLLAFEQI